MKRVYIILIILAIGFLIVPLALASSRRLPNGYEVDPLATGLVESITKVFKGYSEFKKSDSGCTVVSVRYAEVDGQDRIYQWVVKQADRNGNWDGFASSAEVQKLFDTACQNRGK